MTTTVDQQKIRRMRTGLIAYNAARAQAGYTLFSPMYGDGTVYLIDMEGNIAHMWHLPYRPGLYGHLLENGRLLYGGKVMEDLARLTPGHASRVASSSRWTGMAEFRGRSDIRITTMTQDSSEMAMWSCYVPGLCHSNSSAASRADCPVRKPMARCTATTWSK